MAAKTDQEMFEAAQAAELALLAGGKTAQWGDRLVTLANLEEIRKVRMEYERRVKSGSGIRYQRAVFR